MPRTPEVEIARALCPFRVAAIVALLVGCSDDTLESQQPRIVIEPNANTGQLALDNPPGIDLGQVALFGVASGRFTVRNLGTARLDISEIETTESRGGRFEVVSTPDSLGPAETGELVIEFSPENDGSVGSASFNVVSNDERADGRLTLRGEGLFVGNPSLQVCYDGTCYPRDGDCIDGVCELPVLDYGNIAFDTVGSQVITLRNSPAADTCRPPESTPACTPVCRLVVDRGERDIGFALEEGSVFNVAGSIPLPFTVDAPEDDCPFETERDALIRVAAGSDEDTVNDALVIETNDPGAGVVRIPLVASVREAPVAIATLRACDPETPSEPCSQAEDIRPLDRVYLDGRESFDPDDLPLVSYRWRVLESPGDIANSALAVEGFDTELPSFVAAVAGTYRLRLEVTNEDGIVSGVSETSDIEVVAIPTSRLSVELTWRDVGDVDLDLHLTRADPGHRICRGEDDCFWRNCKPSCGPDPDCEPALWFGDTPYEGSNPRLDADDQDGPGPETINIDAPENDRYRLYVHYYGLVNPATVPMSAVVRVLLDGIPRLEFRRELERNEIWRIADIAWGPDGGDIETLPSDGIGVGEVRTLDQCPADGLEFDTLD
ncbi:MAG: choice-of-anchor D domain-containing protein [Myxococcota bacterium]